MSVSLSSVTNTRTTERAVLPSETSKSDQSNIQATSSTPIALAPAVHVDMLMVLANAASYLTKFADLALLADVAPSAQHINVSS